MNSRILLTLAYSLILLGGGMGVAYMWGMSTIIADSTPPQIVQSGTTSGAIAYFTGKPTVTLVVVENLGMQDATAEIFQVGLLGTRGSSVQKVTMTQESKSGTTYQYKGAFTTVLDVNKEYIILYTATDAAGHKATWETRIKMVSIEGKVTVNGVEVKNTWDKIYVNTLDLSIQVTMTVGAAQVDRIQGVVNNEQLSFQRGYATDNWYATYKLPGDGSYTFYIKVVDQAGGDVMLASFGVELGTEQRWPLILGTLGVLGVAAVYFSMEQPKPRKVAAER